MENRNEFKKNPNRVNDLSKDWKSHRTRESIRQERGPTSFLVVTRSRGVENLRQTLENLLGGEKLNEKGGSMSGQRKTGDAAVRRKVQATFGESGTDNNCSSFPSIISPERSTDLKIIKKISRIHSSKIGDTVEDKLPQKKIENIKTADISKMSSNIFSKKRGEGDKVFLKKSLYSSRFHGDSDCEDRSQPFLTDEKKLMDLESSIKIKKTMNTQGGSPSSETINDQLSDASKILQRRISNVIERRKTYENALSALRRNHEYGYQRHSSPQSSDSQLKSLRKNEDDYCQDRTHALQVDTRNCTDIESVTSSNGTSNVQSTSLLNRTPPWNLSKTSKVFMATLAAERNKSDHKSVSLPVAVEKKGNHLHSTEHSTFSPQFSESQQEYFSSHDLTENHDFGKKTSNSRNERKHKSRISKFREKCSRSLFCCSRNNDRSSSSASTNSSKSSRTYILETLRYNNPNADLDRGNEDWRNKTTQTYFTRIQLPELKSNEINTELIDKNDQSTITDHDTHILPESEKKLFPGKLIIPVNVKCCTTLSLTSELSGHTSTMKFADNDVVIEIKGGKYIEKVDFKTQRQEIKPVMNTKIDIWPKNLHIVNPYSTIDVMEKKSTTSAPYVANIPPPWIWNEPSMIFYDPEGKTSNRNIVNDGLRDFLKENKVTREKEFNPLIFDKQIKKVYEKPEVRSKEILKPQKVKSSYTVDIIGIRSMDNVRDRVHESECKITGILRSEGKDVANVSLQTSQDLLESLAGSEILLDLEKYQHPPYIMDASVQTSSVHLNTCNREKENEVESIDYDSPPETGFRFQTSDAERFKKDKLKHIPYDKGVSELPHSLSRTYILEHLEIKNHHPETGVSSVSDKELRDKASSEILDDVHPDIRNEPDNVLEKRRSSAQRMINSKKSRDSKKYYDVQAPHSKRERTEGVSQKFRKNVREPIRSSREDETVVRASSFCDGSIMHDECKQSDVCSKLLNSHQNSNTKPLMDSTSASLCSFERHGRIIPCISVSKIRSTDEEQRKQGKISQNLGEIKCSSQDRFTQTSITYIESSFHSTSVSENSERDSVDLEELNSSGSQIKQAAKIAGNKTVSFHGDKNVHASRHSMDKSEVTELLTNPDTKHMRASPSLKRLERYFTLYEDESEILDDEISHPKYNRDGKRQIRGSLGKEEQGSYLPPMYHKERECIPLCKSMLEQGKTCEMPDQSCSNANVSYLSEDEMDSIHHPHKSTFENMCERIRNLFPCCKPFSSYGSKYSSQGKSFHTEEVRNVSLPTSSTVPWEEKDFAIEKKNNNFYLPVNSQISVLSSSIYPNESETIIKNEVKIGYDLRMLSKQSREKVHFNRNVKGTFKRIRKRKLAPMYQRSDQNFSKPSESLNNVNRNNERNDDGLMSLTRLFARKWSPTYNDLKNIPFMFPGSWTPGDLLSAEGRSACKSPFTIAGSRDALNLNWNDSDFLMLHCQGCENNFLSNSHNFTRHNLIHVDSKRENHLKNSKTFQSNALQSKKKFNKRKISSKFCDTVFSSTEEHERELNIFDDVHPHLLTHSSLKNILIQECKCREGKVRKLFQEEQWNQSVSEFIPKRTSGINNITDMDFRKQIPVTSIEKWPCDHESICRKCDQDAFVDVFVTKRKLFEHLMETEEFINFP